MEYSEQDYKTMQEQAPATLRLFEKWDKIFMRNGIRLWFGDTDHTYDDFRYSLSNFQSMISDKEFKKIEKEFEEDIKTHCCKCGNMGQIRDYNSKFDSFLFHCLCDYCYMKRCVRDNFGIEKIRIIAQYNYRLKKSHQDNSEPIIRLKVRLLNKKNEFFYDFTTNLYHDGTSFYISNEHSKWEKVRYAGLYLGIRDKEGQRVYEGDVVVAIKEDNDLRYWGMAIESKRWDSEENKAINHIFLYHGAGNFPSPLFCAKSFKVVGNVIEGNETKIDDNPNLLQYYKCEEWNKYSITEYD